MSYLPFWVEVAAYKTSLAQSFFIEVPVTNLGVSGQAYSV
jgi:hypothetical protein